MNAMQITDVATTLTPVGDRVIFKRDKVASVTSDGIEIPKEYLERTTLNTGSLVSVSADIPDCPWKVGDRVMIASHCGTSIVEPDTKDEYVILRPGDIYARING
jgi:co-chaperonin GroES (HSP10)